MTKRNSGSKTKDTKPLKYRKGHPPDILRKGSAHRDRTKYNRKDKHRVHNQEDK